MSCRLIRLFVFWSVRPAERAAAAADLRPHQGANVPAEAQRRGAGRRLRHPRQEAELRPGAIRRKRLREDV